VAFEANAADREEQEDRQHAIDVTTRKMLAQ